MLSGISLYVHFTLRILVLINAEPGIFAYLFFLDHVPNGRLQVVRLKQRPRSQGSRQFARGPTGLEDALADLFVLPQGLFDCHLEPAQHGGDNAARRGADN